MHEPINMMTVKEAAVRYDVPEHAVRGWVNDGSLRAVKSGRKILIAEPSLREFLLNGNNYPAPASNVIQYGHLRRVCE